jgi:hypothetical protein
VACRTIWCMPPPFKYPSDISTMSFFHGHASGFNHLYA